MSRLWRCLFPAMVLCAVTAVAGSHNPTFSTSESGSSPVAVSPGQIEVVVLAPQKVTKLTLPARLKIDEIKKGSNIVQVDFNPAANTLNILPTMSEGSTILNVRTGSHVYNFLLKISTNDPPTLARTYTFEEANDDLDAAAAQAPRLKPHEIDTVQAVKIIEKARFDPDYLATLANFRTVPLGLTVIWNRSPVTMVEVDQCADLDLLVFKVEWSNATDSVLNLESSQVRLRITNTGIPVNASQQESPRLFPGQMDTLWLFVQGYRISPHNDWRLVLPPDADAVRKVLQHQ